VTERLEIFSVLQFFESVENRFLDRSFCNELLNPDLERSMLDWLDEPVTFRDRQSDEVWRAFIQQAKSELGFDPAAEGELTGARRLGEAQGSWALVWARYLETPRDFPSIPDLLLRARPAKLFTEGAEFAWPQDNTEAEDSLRSALSGLAMATSADARQQLRDLWLKHKREYTVPASRPARTTE